MEKNNDLEREKANLLKESKCDIIAYLSRQVEIKNNEIIDLDNTVSTLKTVSIVFINISHCFLYFFITFIDVSYPVSNSYANTTIKGYQFISSCII